MECCEMRIFYEKAVSKIQTNTHKVTFSLFRFLGSNKGG